MRQVSLHGAVRRRSLSASVRKVARTLTGRAVEALEPRQLMSAAPTLTISGAPSSNEGSGYVLSLSSSGDTSSIDHWTIDWGDNQTSILAGNPTSAAHQYDDGPGKFQVKASATLTDGTVVPANLGSSNNNGTLDTAFGNSGVALSSLPAGQSYTTTDVRSVVRQSDGKIIAVTVARGTATLFRYNPDGTLDTTFGNNGAAAADFGVGFTPSSGAAAIQLVPKTVIQNGVPVTVYVEELVVGGGAGLNFNTISAAIARFTPSGAPDTTFGNNGILAANFTTSPSFPRYDTVNDLTVQSDGKIVASGTSAYKFDTNNYQDFFTVRLNLNGSLDSSFGTGGVVRTDLNGYNDRAYAVAVQNDGKIVVAGAGVPVTAGVGVAVRYNPDGTLDTSFGNNGVASFFPGFVARDIAFDSSGRILLAGLGGNNSTMRLVRLNPNGSLDTSFGSAGLVDSQASLMNWGIPSVQVQSDGKILLGGGATTGFGYTSQFIALRYNPNGSLDTSFGDLQPGSTTLRTGATRISFPGYTYSFGEAMLLLPDGKLLLAGIAAPGSLYSDICAGGQFAFVRLGGSAAATPVFVQVNNVAPTALLSGLPASAVEGSVIALTASATDPSAADTAAGFIYAWSVTKNGQAYASGSGASINFTPDDNGVYQITLTATDKDGGVGTTTQTITVANVAPTPSISGLPANAYEGSAISLAASAVDPGAADVAAGFSYFWSVTKDGNAYASGSGDSFSFTPDDNGIYAITLTATDKDGDSNAVSQTITVQNVAPIAALGAVSGDLSEGSTISLTGSATDAGPLDSAAGLTYAWSVTKNGQAYASGTGNAISFTPDDNGTYVVTLTATDKDGGVGTASQAIDIANVAPTPSISGLPASAAEGATIALTASATDPSAADTAAGFTYTWSITKNGSAYASGSGVSINFTPDDNGAYAITLTATDKDGGSGSVTRNINIINVAPVAAISAPAGALYEGSAVSLTASATDPSAADVAAGFSYAWSVTRNGVLYASGTGSDINFTPIDNGAYLVTLTATDKDGGSSTATRNLTVLNVAPVVAPIAGDSSGVRGQTLTFLGAYTDPGLLDTHILRWDFGDGQAITDRFLLNPTHVYRNAGTYTLTLTVTDNDGGSSSVSRTVTIYDSQLLPDPFDPTKTTLVIGGLPGSSNIAVNPASGGRVQASVNGTSLGTFNVTGRIVVYAQGSNNDIQISGSITLPTELHGGIGNNRIKGGNGPNIIIGGGGTNTLIGGNDRDLIIGGSGASQLEGQSGDDILIAGSTAFDNDSFALQSIMAEWLRTDVDFLTRVSHLLHGGGRNGDVLLNRSTVFCTSQRDTLNGGPDRNLLIVDDNDKLIGSLKNDVIIDTSWVTVDW